MNGNIHSVETCGTVDGPGIRYIVFTQGCLLRCQYCHNADTWGIGKGKSMSPQEMIDDLRAYLPFIRASGGGITVSGGEPLLQIPFVKELFMQCRELGIHTALDTSGGCFSDTPAFLQELDGLLKYTDLVLLDLKHIDRIKHRKLTGKYNDHILTFAKHLSNKQIPVWVRHVLVPGITDSEEDLMKLGQFIHTLTNVEKVEILPYHKLGVYKWEALGLKYPLQDVEPPSEEAVTKAYQLLNVAN
ncbi:pyruvate formate-lyase-activating protein [Bacillus sp. CECT 9360]|uniref:pyruvate formate-lyase-activating protein n=1 Tax=Bacillus sp. CECT 9360 TaxID=2845821 RepID=UPI001E3F9D4E|nr:pyruvate formate-lyase-activating protein [Bacillus sp. CECT 9360]CAH0345210.1 Pyruvate formate-lyase-activating enzyme [Bacillus sp. CECT 9360]